jgi:heme/copper-type cytochrome/quinol oxidase subunit 2
MYYVRPFWRKLKLVAVVVACWLAVHGTTLAREAKQAAEKQQGGAGSWVSSYALVLLGIVLGLLGVCLTSRRRERDRPETYAQTKVVQESKKN